MTVGPALREAARRALAASAGSEPDPASHDERIDRAVLDVTIDGRTEMVTVALRDGELVCTTSDGRHDGPHVRAALRLLGGGASGETSGVGGRAFDEVQNAGHEDALEARERGGDDGSGMREALLPGEAEAPFPDRSQHSEAPELSVEAPRITVTETAGGGRITLPPGATRTVEEPHQPPSADRAALASALDDVITAVVRVGAREADESPSVDDGLTRLQQAAPRPVPLGIARWAGRMRQAIARHDVDMLARLLDGASRVASDLRKTEPDEDALERIGSWLGAVGDTTRDIEHLYERTLIEVAREWLPGIERAGIERRYLVDPSSGAIHREERPRGGSVASVGPCPRVMSVGFGDLERGARPRRARLLQYAVSLEVGESDWTRVGATALRSFRVLADEYRHALETFPGLAEPFVLVAPATQQMDDDGLVMLDFDEYPLPIARAEDPAGAARLDAIAREQQLEWIAGRVVDADGHLMLVPCSTATLIDGKTKLHRIR